MKVDKAAADGLVREAAPAALEEITAGLRDLGLSGNAANAFGAMLRSRESTAADLVARTRIPDSKIYYALEELAEAGLVEVQAGKPKLYRVVPPREVRERLSSLVEDRAERNRARATRVSLLVEPLRSSASSPSADLAYIVKGRTNVVARARTMVSSARKELLLMASDPELMADLAPQLRAAAGTRVRLRIAARDDALDPAVARKAETREIRCDCAVLVSDGQQVLTIDSLKDGTWYGIVSVDETLVRMASEYWDSPNCCEC
jgi:sugar-specific transcriptional regulator TrmB